MIHLFCYEPGIDVVTPDGTDAHAEAIERLTGFAFLGDSTDEYLEARPCHMSGTPTTRRVLLAKTY